MGPSSSRLSSVVSGRKAYGGRAGSGAETRAGAVEDDAAESLAKAAEDDVVEIREGAAEDDVAETRAAGAAEDDVVEIRAWATEDDVAEPRAGAAEDDVVETRAREAEDDVVDEGVALGSAGGGGGFRMSLFGPEVPRETPCSIVGCRACLATTVVEDAPVLDVTREVLEELGSLMVVDLGVLH